jgi:uncharacterized protein (DUF2147 family)
MRLASTLATLLVSLLAASQVGAADPTGRWWAEGGAAQVEITRCGDALCGRVAWLRAPLDESGCLVRDAENPDPALRGRSLIGVDLLQNLRPSAGDPSEWTGGEIYDPTSGRVYRAALRMDGPDHLRLRGYLGIQLLGRTTTWIRVGREMQCREPA